MDATLIDIVLDLQRLELVSTNNRSENFSINDFSINMKAYEVRPRS